MSRNQIILIVVGGLLLAIGIPVTLFLISQQQDQRSRASEVVYPPDITSNVAPTTPPVDTQQACEAPAAPASTEVQYPHMEGDQFDLNTADCGWESVEGAASYNVAITEVGTNTVIRDDSVPSNTTAIAFPVTQGATYRCEIEAVSDCGTTSAVSSDEAECSTEGFVSPTPTVTQPPVTQPPVTQPPVVTTAPPSSPPVTPPATGSTEVALAIGGVVSMIIIGGAALLFW